MNLNTAINVTAAGTGLAAVGGLTHVAGRTAIDSHDPKLSEHDRDGAYVLSIMAGGFGAGITGLGGLAATGVLTDKPLTAVALICCIIAFPLTRLVTRVEAGMLRKLAV